jgi:hypothetical protein
LLYVLPDRYWTQNRLARTFTNPYAQFATRIFNRTRRDFPDSEIGAGHGSGMTSPEHTLVGIHAALAMGCHRHWGWPVVALAGLASNIPDWDGIPMLVDMQRFESGHRVWGHNVFAILLTTFLVTCLQRRFQWIEAVGQRVKRFLPADAQQLVMPSEAAPVAVYFIVAFAAQMIHLPCDMVVSGGKGLSDWHVCPLWPASHIGFAFPLIPWGDVGPTLILMAGILAAAIFRDRSSAISALALAGLVAYLLVRGCMRGTLDF